MSVSAIQALSEMELALPAGTRAAGSENFATQMLAEVQKVNDKLVEAETNLRELAAGKQTNLHHVMLSLEEARMSFQLLVQVRNKVLDAYQDVLRMQV